jgi:hypothetical protein
MWAQNWPEPIKGVAAVGEGAGGGRRLDLGDAAGGQAARLQQRVAVDPDPEPLELLGHNACDRGDVAGDEDRDRRGAMAGQLVGVDLRDQRNPEVALLDDGSGGVQGGER